MYLGGHGMGKKVAGVLVLLLLLYANRLKIESLLINASILVYSRNIRVEHATVIGEHGRYG